MDFSSVVDRGGGNKAGEAEDILGTIAGSGGGRGSIASAQDRQQWRLPEPPPLPLPARRASLAREVMARMQLSLSPSFLVGVLKLIIIYHNISYL